MLKKLTLIIFAMLAIASAFAQGTKTKPAMGKMTTVYACDHCNMTSAKVGKCKMCKMDMHKASTMVTYHCDHCKKDMAKGGSCPMCKGKLTKMTTHYDCDHCKTSSSKAGNCPKCKMAMTKHEAKG